MSKPDCGLNELNDFRIVAHLHGTVMPVITYLDRADRRVSSSGLLFYLCMYVWFTDARVFPALFHLCSRIHHISPILSAEY